MSNGSEHAALAANLTSCADELATLARRVERDAALTPRIASSGWSGPASLACQLSVRLLARELDAAIELLRCAADLTGAAAWEVRQ